MSYLRLAGSSPRAGTADNKGAEGDVGIQVELDRTSEDFEPGISTHGEGSRSEVQHLGQAVTQNATTSYGAVFQHHVEGASADLQSDLAHHHSQACLAAHVPSPVHTQASQRILGLNISSMFGRAASRASDAFGARPTPEKQHAEEVPLGVIKTSIATADGKLRDTREVDLLIQLARAMVQWGAPLYRVEHRIKSAAEALEIPISMFSLPATLMVAIGDGGVQHPSRTYFVQIVGTNDMRKLHQADRLARRLSMINIRFERIKMQVAASKHESMHEDDDPYLEHFAERLSQASAHMPTSSKNLHAQADSPFKWSSLASMLERRPSAEIRLIHKSDAEPAIVEEVISEFEKLLAVPNALSSRVRIFAASLQSAMMSVLLFHGSLADSIASLFLGALAGTLQSMADEYQAPSASVILIAGVVCFFGRIAQTKYIWQTLPGSGYGLCFDVVSIASLSQYLPGIQFTLAMLELGTDYTVAGAVRMFQAFIRSMMVGYGATFGSKLAVFVLEYIEAFAIDDAAKACPSAEAPYAIQWWRLPLFFPMIFSVMLLMRAHSDQFLHISISSLTCFIIATFSRLFLSGEISSALAALALGIVANAWARLRDSIAIAAVLAGILWLVPGAVGIRGAIAAFSGSSMGLSFGTEILLRTMSIAIGLFIANALVYPMAPKHRRVMEDDSLAV
ncbi:hypothetical protein HK105_202846 [Polyrhizophydium stewartii]|uniref:Threonine/serine exporter-like N-terminal domain-containing protein n=1 Tax=Polyrhizophydium stewartii TaxID=2732419 RepID=A0ABR4NDH4_9FUNG